MQVYISEVASGEGRVASKRGSGRPKDSGQASDESEARVPPPRVFVAKSSDLLENKGVEVFGNDKEFVND